MRRVIEGLVVFYAGGFVGYLLALVLRRSARDDVAEVAVRALRCVNREDLDAESAAIVFDALAYAEARVDGY